MKKTTGRDWSATRATPVESPAPRSLLIRGARVLDPASGFDGTAHVGIRDGLISSFGAALPKQRFEQTINADGQWLLPGIVDLCARFREPGQTHKASFASETPAAQARSEEHTSELQSLMRHSYAVFCLKKN